MVLSTETNDPLNRLLWIDCEFTGLSVKRDAILEIAAVATNQYLQPLASYSSFVHHDTVGIDVLLDQNEWWDSRANHRTLMVDGTTTETKTLAEIESELQDFTSNWVGESNVILAGNSIYNDRQFLARDFPAFAESLSYRMLDVSSFKIVAKSLLGVEYPKKETHRAFEDVQESIDELRFILGLMGNSDVRRYISTNRVEIS